MAGRRCRGPRTRRCGCGRWKPGVRAGAGRPLRPRLERGVEPDGRQALSGSEDNTVRLWEVETGRACGCWKATPISVLSVALSPDGRRALSGSADNTVRVWEVESGACVRVLEGHSASVWSVALSPDGRQALSGSADTRCGCGRWRAGSACGCWKATPPASGAWPGARMAGRRCPAPMTTRCGCGRWRAGACVRVLEGHSAGVWSVAWSPDGGRRCPAPRTTRCGCGRWKRGVRAGAGRPLRSASGAWPGAPMAAVPFRLPKTECMRVWDLTGAAARTLATNPVHERESAPGRRFGRGEDRALHAAGA